MVQDAAHILVVDDDARLRDLLAKFLQEHGFMVTTAKDAQQARARIGVLSFDLMVLDLMMPGESGLDFAADLRGKSDIPILMLTAMGEPEDRVTGLEKGADDYLVKPFEPRELLLRINNILRRAPSLEVLPVQVTLGQTMFDMERGELSRGGERIHLTDIEAILLKALAERPGVILSREELSEYTGTRGGGRAVDVQVTRLRRKIEEDVKLPRYLQTVRGKGYVLRPD
ncbi:MAG: response regulator [Rhodospirillales bacterium]|jgi:two-component system phosphate regulon response regulator OmpR